ncbi:glycoside hydrolase family 38 N-terminal domain-containing protein [Actinomarinicola tropica]|uniref:Alpha-mannosidase n=1 Tax=Actinomarinicola tropica TaxID=2789776 RepID=A0A5Q2RL10_9ACTN|nr:glycoside hydrolase family 38 C-terminal domain-containing protein [Actinomarinicola tropica]QGG94747.1 alpha-mannosidase [Actinomarinicola tropica]
MARQVSVVPHTHWDREWYLPFQTFRAKLVGLLDELLPRLERDPSYAHFLLDGQMAVVDDHLAIRPEAEPVLQRLAATGRVAMGPWYVLMDEFLVSGETIVRNLQAGRRRADHFGGAMEVGYLPDMFGHVAQMPQILRQFGLEHAVVWRGTPSAVDRTGFWWRAPDGSTVRAEYTPQGYGNGAALPDDAKDLVERIREFDETHRALIGDAPVLWMNGTDHQVPFPTLGAVVAAANELQDDYQLVVRSLSDHLAAAPTEGLPTWEGELRSGSRANLLMGVASNRVDVKQAAARAERGLERLAEPLAALVEDAGLAPWPRTLLELAWHEVILSSAHDSICACSIDPVVDAVLVRLREATDVAHAVVDAGLHAIGQALAAPGVVVVNTVARPRAGLVELDLPGTAPDDDPRLQVLDEVPARSLALRVTRADAPTVVERELDIHLGVHGVEIDEAADGTLDVTIHADPANRSAPTYGWVARQLTSLAAADPDAEVRIWVEQPPRHRALVRTPEVPGLAWAPWSPRGDVDPVTVAADGLLLSNGSVVVEIDPADGTFALDGHRGLGRLVDDGDEGDTYNYSPPARQSVVDAPTEVVVEVLERGPLRARVAIDARYPWPERIDDGARVGEVPTALRTTLELRAGERFVRIATSLENRSRDHRLRVHLPLPEPAATSQAECAFAVVERGLTAEGGPTERGIPTFPSRRFVRAGGLTVVHEGLLEYELVDVDGDPAAPDARARTLALTLLRCTGWLSRPPMAYRPLPAGPVVETPGAQVQGRHELHWAVSAADVDPYVMADDVLVPLLVARGDGGGHLPDRHQLLSTSGAEVSAVLGGAERTRVRVVNPWTEATEVDLGDRAAWIEDLRGQVLERVDGTFTLPAGRIATLSLDPRSGDQPND